MLDWPLHFLRPWWWLALAPLPLVLWLLWHAGSGRAAFARLVDATLLPALLHGSGARRWRGTLLVGVAWLLATIALTGPAWQREATPLYVNGAARVVVLSLADDMLAQDLPPDRMVRARLAAHDLIDAAADARTALVAYAGAAFTVAPLTSDRNTVLNLLRALQPDVMPVRGNDAAAGITQGAVLLRDAKVRGGEIILVTDRADAAAAAAARQAHADGMRVDVLGVGTAEGAPVPQAGGGFAGGTTGTRMARRDDASLRAVAAAGGGSYAILPVDGAATPAFAAPLAQAGHANHDAVAQIWRDGGIWLLPLLVMLAALAFRRGWLLVLAVLVLPVAMPTAQAATPSAWWSNRDQRALQALRAGDAQQARRLATAPGLRGAAEYRAGDYAGAASAFARGDDARAHYNLGNALAKQGEYPQAIAAYREALRQDPKLADAQANLDAVEAWLQQKPPQAPDQRQDGTQSPHGEKGSGTRKSGSGHAGDKAGEPGQASPSAAADASVGPHHGQDGMSKPASASSGTPPAGGDTGKTAAAEAQRQSAQSAQAAAGLQRELQGAGKAHRPRSAGPASTFALGRDARKPDGQLDAQQRALLQAVPDDPGALLRRKFQLEWERRGGQAQDGGSR